MRNYILSWSVGIALLVLAWEIASLFMNPFIVPPPADVVFNIFAEFSRHFGNAAVTGLQATGGLLVAATVAGTIVILTGMWPKTEAAFHPYIVMLKASPAIAFAPLLVTFVGTGPWCKILVSAMIAFFPLVVGGIDGLKATPERLLLMSQAYGGGSWKMLKTVKAGYAVSGFLTGLKTAAPLSVIGAMVGEFVGGGRPTGLGTFILVNNTGGLSVQVFAGAVISTSLGVMFFSVATTIKELSTRRLHLGD